MKKLICVAVMLLLICLTYAISAEAKGLVAEIQCVEVTGTVRPMAAKACEHTSLDRCSLNEMRKVYNGPSVHMAEAYLRVECTECHEFVAEVVSQRVSEPHTWEITGSTCKAESAKHFYTKTCTGCKYEHNYVEICDGQHGAIMQKTDPKEEGQ